MGDGKIQEICQLPASTQRRGRVKGVARGNPDEKGIVFAVGFSQGLVEVWLLTDNQEISGAFQRLHAVETETRLTCLVYWAGLNVARPSEKTSARNAPLTTTAA